MAEEANYNPKNNENHRYSEGLAKLDELRARYRELNGQQLEDLPHRDTANAPVTGFAQPKKASLEIELLEKGRARALEEFNGHQVKAEAFQLLSGRYRDLGLESQSDAYGERGQLEGAASRGFKAVLQAYDRKLSELGIEKRSSEIPQNLHMAYRSLDLAEQFLDGSKSDYGICCDHTIQVLRAEETLKKLESNLFNRPLTPVEKEQLGKAAEERDRFMRQAEREAINSAVAFEHFRSEIQSAEQAHNAFSRALMHESSAEQTQVLQEPLPAASESRMNRLAVGMVVCQALKVLDREL
ncbi:MAG: hypothetical protein QUT30_15770 [Acidobacteriota bacterium]|nr:hypothetical protein [Acidobacteriota bacterium]